MDIQIMDDLFHNLMAALLHFEVQEVICEEMQLNIILDNRKIALTFL